MVASLQSPRELGRGRFRAAPAANVVALDHETGNPAVLEAKGFQYLLDNVAQAARLGEIGAVFLLLMLGNIHERGEMLDSISALILNRADEDGGPEQAAILAAVTDFRMAIGAALDLIMIPRRASVVTAVLDSPQNPASCSIATSTMLANP